MGKLTDKTPRRIAARRMTGGLAALVTAGAMTTGTAQSASDTQPNDDPILLTQASGEGESAAGGEGEGEGSAGLEPETAFLSGLGFMEGHIRAGLALYEQGDLEAAKTHMGHPIEEKYDAVADRLAELGLDGMKDDLSALAAAAESDADFEKVSSLFDTVHAGIEDARAEYSRAQQVDGLIALTRVAGDEYKVAVAGGKVSNLHEYQDSWGFLRTIEHEAREMADSDDTDVAKVGAAILEQIEATGAAFGDLQGEGSFDMEPGILYGAAARMELAANQLSNGEGDGQ
ncbi:hypothetical protein ACROSR_01640 [Roseovarius tibetensis]|uniref:hypothetical protein n=1 Tax=Roseovarius tibetensis TaxID=2685897 RepID=UPI003D7F43E3